MAIRSTDSEFIARKKRRLSPWNKVRFFQFLEVTKVVPCASRMCSSILEIARVQMIARLLKGDGRHHNRAPRPKGDSLVRMRPRSSRCARLLSRGGWIHSGTNRLECALAWSSHQELLAGRTHIRTLYSKVTASHLRPTTSLARGGIPGPSDLPVGRLCLVTDHRFQRRMHLVLA